VLTFHSPLPSGVEPNDLVQVNGSASGDSSCSSSGTAPFALRSRDV
jgi:hypothetical protein